MKVKHWIIILALLCLALFAAAPAWADDGTSAKIDPSVNQALDAAGQGEQIPVIVYAPGHLDDVVSADVPAAMDSQELPVVDGVATYLNADQIDQAAADPNVVAIAADNPVYAADAPPYMDVTNQAIGLGGLLQPEAGGPTGQGVTVAIIDSGTAKVSDLSDGKGGYRIVGWKDFVHFRRQPYDDAGHGTFVAGLIAGNGSASLPIGQGGYATTQFRGVAPQANIVSIKVLDQYGQGRESSVILGLVWAIVHRHQYGIRVVNLSIAGNVAAPTRYDPMAMVVEAAWKAGIVVVCAAGNEGDFGRGGVLSPGNDPYVITVGALDTQQTADTSDDAVAHYSSIGPTLYDEFAKPDVLAPGNRVVSCRVPGSYIDQTFPGNIIPVSSYAPGAPDGYESQYFVLSGTSTSTPVVAGAAALMIGADPSLSPDDVKVRLMDTATKVPGADPYQEGAGVINMPAAMASTEQSNGYALSAKLGDGTTILTPDTYSRWDSYVWTKYAWTKYKWTKYKWTKYKWTKYAWTKYAWTKYAWTKYKWTKYAWTTLINGQ
jgi:serine protease AprX